MTYQNGATCAFRKDFEKSERSQVSLKDVPLEVRRREARKPLFLTRYE